MTDPVAAYSGRPLVAKLGYRPALRLGCVGLPQGLHELLAAAGILAETAASPGALADGPFDALHLFTRARADLAAALPEFRRRLQPAGMIWVSWPRKAAKLPTDLDENVVRALALANGLVDVKVCAVDAVWSGLKLLIPRARR